MSIVSSWKPFNTVISAKDGSPSVGSATISSYYLLKDNLLNISFTLHQTSAGTSGIGTYLFSLPSGCTIDTSVIALEKKPSVNGTICGCCYAFQTCVDAGTGICVAYSPTQYIMYISTLTTIITPIGSSYFPLGSSSELTYSANLSLPII